MALISFSSLAACKRGLLKFCFSFSSNDFHRSKFLRKASNVGNMMAPSYLLIGGGILMLFSRAIHRQAGSR